MAIRRPDFSNPAFQDAYARSQKGYAAVPGAASRGLVQGFAGQEGKRLQNLDRATESRERSKLSHAAQMEGLQQDLSLTKERMDFEKSMADQAMLGTIMSLPLSILQVGMGYSDRKKSKKATADQAEFNKFLQARMYENAMARGGPGAGLRMSQMAPRSFGELHREQLQYDNNPGVDDNYQYRFPYQRPLSKSYHIGGL